MAHWRKFWALSGHEQRRLVQALLLLPLLNGALYALGLRRLQRLLAWLTPLRQPLAGELARQQAAVLAHLVAMAANHGPYRATCLRRSLLVWWWLRGVGIAGELRIGARIVEGQLQAHAWVEYLGTPVNEIEHVTASYAVFPAIQPQWRPQRL